VPGASTLETRSRRSRVELGRGARSCVHTGAVGRAHPSARSTSSDDDGGDQARRSISGLEAGARDSSLFDNPRSSSTNAWRSRPSFLASAGIWTPRQPAGRSEAHLPRSRGRASKPRRRGLIRACCRAWPHSRRDQDPLTTSRRADRQFSASPCGRPERLRLLRERCPSRASCSARLLHAFVSALPRTRPFLTRTCPAGARSGASSIARGRTSARVRHRRRASPYPTYHHPRPSAVVGGQPHSRDLMLPNEAAVPWSGRKVRRGGKGRDRRYRGLPARDAAGVRERAKRLFLRQRRRGEKDRRRRDPWRPPEKIAARTRTQANRVQARRRPRV